MHKKVFLFFSLFFLFSCSENNENIIPQNNTPDIEVTKISDLDLVKKYFNYLSKKDYLSAYNLKETDKTLEDFISVYSDSGSFIKYSSEKLDNGNIKSINIIDNIPYEGFFEVIDGKIKTISTIELKDYIYSNGVLKKRKVEEILQNVVYYLKDGIFNEKYRSGLYQILYFPEGQNNLYKNGITLATHPLLSYRYYIDSSIQDLLTLDHIDSNKQLYMWEYLDGMNPLYVEKNKFKETTIKDINGRKVIVQNYTNGKKFYIFTQRLDKNNVVVYTGFDVAPDFYSKEKLIKSFNNLEKNRLSKLKIGECYSHQGNINCIMEDGKESPRFINIDSEEVDCSPLGYYKAYCSTSIGDNNEISDFYFGKTKKNINVNDFFYRNKNNKWVGGTVTYDNTDLGLELLHLYKEYRDGRETKNINGKLNLYNSSGILIKEKTIFCSKPEIGSNNYDNCISNENIDGKSEDLKLRISLNLNNYTHSILK